MNDTSEPEVCQGKDEAISIRIRFFATLNIFDGDFLFSCVKPERPRELIGKNTLDSFFRCFFATHACSRLIRFSGHFASDCGVFR
jgi:hypothetical protein